ncbi:TetR family transcriptional regulator [Simplicispira sp. 125]|uniref:TetR/AcrR family transcriptional regulator n=2 Tax=unclassified Simplicispira TaxID=2630407 RepID=UPI000D5E28DD|nr:TetR/AcrR family transcriptional regulator [Simplicispira sp. 125]PVY56509.1 TetR family transcriptional regulator [Simplicispira sp. 125]REG17454.1 TetR family transcriptional regulator [Simplicispira sp. 110]
MTRYPTQGNSETQPLEQTAPSVPATVRERLSPVVMEIYAAGDFHRVDMRTIAREAGMSFRTIYRYFGDKESLLFYFIQYWLGGLYPAALKPLDGDGDLRSKLLGVLKLHFEFYEKNPNVGRIIFMTVPLERWMRDPSYAQRELMLRMLKAISDAQQQGELRYDLDSRLILDMFNAIFNRAFLMWEYRRRSYSLTAQAELLLSVLWNGVIANKPPAKSTVEAAVKKASARKTAAK